MLAPLSPATPARLMESEGIGYCFAGALPQEPGGHRAASKNEIAIESIEVMHEKLDTAAKGIIAILIGL